MEQNLELLKAVLSVPTATYHEERMVEFLVNWLTENNIEHYVDENKNVYATKQESKELPEGFYFPCVISHTDTVHGLNDINVREEMLPNAQKEIKLSYKGYDNDSVINYTWAGHTSMRSVCFIPEWNRFTSAISIDEYLTKFNSAFEAFLWVHENYPEELKKKFDEVMG
jgi:hypothetical protein